MELFVPELPEVEISRRYIEQHITNMIILHVVVRNDQLRWPVSKEIHYLNNKLIISVQRRAKYILLELPDGWIIIHLGMSGNLQILTRKLPPKKHDHIDLVMNDNKILRYRDPRRFGSWLWTNELKEHKFLHHLGPEPLSKEFNSYYLKSKCINRKIAIKPYLMNNRLVVGIGNIYANESLFMAKIHPNKPAHLLSEKECELLVQTIKFILSYSIELGGTTIKNFLRNNNKPGGFTKELKVYFRKNKPCFVCSTLIITTKHGQRTTFYCPICQN